MGKEGSRRTGNSQRVNLEGDRFIGPSCKDGTLGASFEKAGFVPDAVIQAILKKDPDLSGEIAKAARNIDAWRDDIDEILEKRSALPPQAAERKERRDIIGLALVVANS